MKGKLLKVALASGVVLAGSAIWKVHEFISSNEQSNIAPTGPSTKSLIRTPIFADGSISTPHLSPLLVHSNEYGKAKFRLDESRLNDTLKSFLREHLKKIFQSKGWNFDDLSGRIYYQIFNTSIDVYVVWRNNRFSEGYTNYDRFSIRF